MDAELDTRLKRIEQMTLLAAKDVLSVKDVALLTGFKESYIRKLVEESKLPHYRPLGKTLFFDKAEIISFLRTNRIPSAQEIVAAQAVRRNKNLIPLY